MYEVCSNLDRKTPVLEDWNDETGATYVNSSD